MHAANSESHVSLSRPSLCISRYPRPSLSQLFLGLAATELEESLEILKQSWDLVTLKRRTSLKSDRSSYPTPVRDSRHRHEPDAPCSHARAAHAQAA